MKKFLSALLIIISVMLAACNPETDIKEAYQEDLSYIESDIPSEVVITIPEASSSPEASSQAEASETEVSQKETPSSYDSVSEAESVYDYNEVMVWIPRTGKKYHSNPRCSNMKSPSHVSIDEAIDYGYTPCKNCY